MTGDDAAHTAFDHKEGIHGPQELMIGQEFTKSHMS